MDSLKIFPTNSTIPKDAPALTLARGRQPGQYVVVGHSPDNGAFTVARNNYLEDLNF